MQEVEKLAEYLSLISLQSLNEDLLSGDADKAKDSFQAKVTEMNDEFEKEKQRHLESSHRQSSAGDDSRVSKAQWSEAEMVFLVKAVNLFPAGTVQRWEVVGSFILQHVPTFKRTPKEVLSKAKELQKMDPANLKQQANEKAYERFEKGFKSAGSAEKSAASERYDSVALQQIGETGSNPAPWTAEEQKLLEQALKTFSASTPERWEKIAEAVPHRSKKDCMKRYKELVEMVKAKKAAQAAVKTKK
jgi:DnaJ family protein C protein 2